MLTTPSIRSTNCSPGAGQSSPSPAPAPHHKPRSSADAYGEPAITVDTKKKERVGDFKNNGRELRPKGKPEEVRTHVSKTPQPGKVAPYGVYDIAANYGWVNVGIDADTGAFAVESIRRWWNKLGRARYPDATCLTITADCGGGKGAQVRLSKREVQRFANETGLKVTVAHLPPGTSKWHVIAHLTPSRPMPPRMILRTARTGWYRTPKPD